MNTAKPTEMDMGNPIALVDQQDKTTPDNENKIAEYVKPKYPIITSTTLEPNKHAIIHQPSQGSSMRPQLNKV